jgi:1-deoxy-D-xylulose-5-phosphate synthase
LTIMQPCDEAELARMLVTALGHDGPTVIRYPRDAGPGTPVPDAPEALTVGRAAVVEPVAGGLPGKPAVWFWALGDMLPLACAAAQRLREAGCPVGVVNARFIKPLDVRLLAEQAATGAVFATLENGVLAGGFGSALQEALADQPCANPVVRFGWPDAFVEQGTTASLMASHNLTAPQVAAQVLTRMGR